MRANEMILQAHQTLPANLILRRKQVEAATGYSRSTIYLRISQGVFVRPVSLGARAVGFPAGEIETMNAARISGKSDEEIRKLVEKLHSCRTEVRT